MKLSVLIPTYNYKCYTLVADLHEQLERSGVEYEILVADDGSTDTESILSNRSLEASFDKVFYMGLPKSHNRGEMRNRLCQLGKYEWQLQINANVRVLHTDFIERYISAVSNSHAQVFCGCCTSELEYSPANTSHAGLRDRYELCFHRNNTPEHLNRIGYFRNTNCLYHRSVFEKCQYDETVQGYGYEDTLFGKILKDAGVRIVCIDNPVAYPIQGCGDDYLQRIEESLVTLHSMSHKLDKQIPLLRTVDRLREMRLLCIVRLSFMAFKPLLRHNLLGRNPNIKVLSLYKLGYYASLG